MTRIARLALTALFGLAMYSNLTMAFCNEEVYSVENLFVNDVLHVLYTESADGVDGCGHDWRERFFVDVYRKTTQGWKRVGHLYEYYGHVATDGWYRINTINGDLPINHCQLLCPCPFSGPSCIH